MNPIRIGIRDKSLAILDKAMRNNPEARIQYAKAGAYCQRLEKMDWRIAGG
ncbi:MAG: hypothetical protein R2795_18895 [Saprospiraceae bacterium]